MISLQSFFHIRNGLAHQLSLPSYIGMINTKSEAREFFRETTCGYACYQCDRSYPSSEVTVNDIVQKYPDAILDPNPKGPPRAPAKQVILPSGASGSPAGRHS